MSKRSHSPNALKIRSRAKYMCKFQQDWIKDFEFVQRSTKSDNHVYCTFCKVDISVGAGGKNDLTRHSTSKKHSDHVKALKKVAKLSHFMPVGDKELDEVSLYLGLY